VYPGDLRQHDNRIAAEARRLAREYAAKKAREDAAKKAKLAAKKAAQKKWDACVEQYGRQRSAKCGANPSGKKSGGGGWSWKFPSPVKIGKHLWKHGFASWQLCNTASHMCGKFKIQNGRISILTSYTTTPAKPGLGSLFPTVGYALKSSGREKASISGAYGRWGVGVGVRKDGSLNWSDMDGSVGLNPAGGWRGAENGGIAAMGMSYNMTVASWCVWGSCK
jgi:hypothetical protein